MKVSGVQSAVDLALTGRGDSSHIAGSYDCYDVTLPWKPLSRCGPCARRRVNEVIAHGLTIFDRLNLPPV